MAVASPSVTDTCLAARAASRALATMSSADKDVALLRVADALEERAAEVLEANARDLEAGREAGLSDALMDRLALDPARIAGIADAVRAIAALPDPVGEVIDGQRLPNGLDLRKVRVPLGVVAVIYESRPNVTVDAAALCLKSGNAVVLRGSAAAAHSNAVLASIVAPEFPDGAVALLTGGREQLAELATQEGVVDLIIPRGGEGLKKALSEVARVPVIYAASGNCHVYVDASADLDDCAADRDQREDAAARHVQRGGDAAGARGRGVLVPARGGRGAARRRRRAAGRGARRRAARRRRGGHRGGLRRGVPRARARRARSSTPTRRRSSTSTATARATPRRS